MKARIYNILYITKFVILADLLWKDLTLLVTKWIFCRIGRPGIILMSPASSIQILRNILRDLIICIRLCGGENVITLSNY